MTFECLREEEVVRAVLAGAWAHADEELKNHAAHCDICADVVAIAAVMREDALGARTAVHVPAAGQVWWRSAVRARLERSHAATQPITWLHGISAAIAIGVLLALASFLLPSITGSFPELKELVLSMMPNGAVATAMFGALRQSSILAAIVLGGLIITPVVVYFALSE
jgi:hypothetical protein